MFTYHIYVRASKTPKQTYSAGLEAESLSTSIACVWCICVCVLGGGELLEIPWCVQAAKTLASLCALYSLLYSAPIFIIISSL